MKKKKKVFILSDGRIFFNLTIPFYQKNSILLSLNDSFSFSNWIYSSINLKSNFNLKK